ncbi:hypothetical protein G0U57_017474, partial [Chelydra serpentina]
LTCPLSGQLYTVAIKSSLQSQTCRTQVAEPELQDSSDLVQVEACQAIYSAAFSTQVNWVKNSGLVVGDGWQVNSFPSMLQAIRWSTGPLLSLGVYLSVMHPSLPENWQSFEGRVAEWLQRWIGLLQCLSLMLNQPSPVH